jgi:CRISPR/Cas system-associated exonuclease Cas4 (RecB family)
MRITGSSLPLLRNCQWWARPEVEGTPFTPTEAMRLGTDVHRCIDAILSGKFTAELLNEVVPEAADYLDAWGAWWGKSPLGYGDGWESEAAYAYDPRTDRARRLDTIDRRYLTEVGEIAGTVDAVRVIGKKATVVDWKTGQDFAGLTADAADNWQLRLYALCVSRCHAVSEVTIAIVRITPDGVSLTEYTLDELELDAVASEVASLAAAVPESAPQPGAHCKRCRAVAVCPTTVVAQDALAPVNGASVALKVTADNAAALLLRLRQVQAACEVVEAELKRYAIENNTGIDLGNGKRWVRQSVDRESVSLTGADRAAGMAALEAFGVNDAVEVKYATSKAAIERSMKAQGLKGKELKAKMDELLSDLRASGVMRSVTVDSFREVE